MSLAWQRRKGGRTCTMNGSFESISQLDEPTFWGGEIIVFHCGIKLDREVSAQRMQSPLFGHDLVSLDCMSNSSFVLLWVRLIARVIDRKASY